MDSHHNLAAKYSVIVPLTHRTKPVCMLHSITHQHYAPGTLGVEPDIWLGLVSNGSEAYPMLMGKGGSSTRYEGMKQRGTSILKTFIIYSIFSYGTAW